MPEIEAIYSTNKSIGVEKYEVEVKAVGICAKIHLLLLFNFPYRQDYQYGRTNIH